MRPRRACQKTSRRRARRSRSGSPFRSRRLRNAQAGLHEVDASSAKDAVKGPRLRVADPVVAEAAEEEAAPRSAHDQVIATVALDPVVAEAAVEAIDRGADSEAGIVVAG